MYWRKQWHPLQYSCLENPMDGGTWWAAVHGVAKSQTRLSDFTFTFHFHALEKEMATHSSALAWRIPGTGEPDGLPSLGSHRVGYDWSDLAAAAAKRSVVAEVVDSSCSAEYYNSWYMLLYFCPNPECKTPLGKHNVNYRLWVMMLCQCRFINCNKWPDRKSVV